MNAALPTSVAPALPAAPATLPVGPAAVLPATPPPATAGAMPAPGTAPRFDRALQRLLGQDASALPQPGADPLAALTASLSAQPLPADTADDASAASAPQPDTALLASMQALQLPAPPTPLGLASTQPAPVQQPGTSVGTAAVAGAAAASVPHGAAAALPPALPVADAGPAAPVPSPAALPAALPAATALPQPVQRQAKAQPAAGPAVPANPTSAAPPSATALPTPHAAAPAADPLDNAAATQTPERPATAIGSAPHATRTAEGLEPGAAADATPRRAPSLLDTLGDRIALQMQRGSERVVIRLDPPLRGQLEITIRQEAGGATQVHLQASHGEVLRQLHTIGDSLRQELAQRHGGEVQVQIAQQPRDQDGRQRQAQQERDAGQQQPGRAWDEHDEAAGTASFALADTP